MATVIDALVVELGLATKKYDEGRPKVSARIDQITGRAGQAFKETEAATSKLVQSFALLQARLLAIGGLLAAGIGLSKFTLDIAQANSEMGRLSSSLGVTAKEMAGWQAVGKTVNAT